MLEYISASLLLNCWISTVRYCSSASVGKLGDLADLISILDSIVQIGEFVKQLFSFIVHIQSLLFHIKESLLCRIQIFRQSVFCQTARSATLFTIRCTYRVLYARPNSLCRYSSIEFVNVAGIAIASHLAKLARNKCG
jgi:hypothetical protein